MIDRPTRHDGRLSLRNELANSLNRNDPVTTGDQSWRPLSRRARLLSLRSSDSQEARVEAVRAGLADSDEIVRHAALEVCGRDPSLSAELIATLTKALRSDTSEACREAAAFAIGESGRIDACETLLEVVGAESAALVRESLVAAIGALGCPDGLDALIEHAQRDKPSVRRRAIVALAAFDDARAEAAIADARSDRDRYVREAAQWLLRPS